MSSSDNDTNISNTEKVLQDTIAEFVCPITMEFPRNPVIAEDGRIYERSAIEEYIRMNKAGGITSKPIRSPFTNKKMGSKLVPAIQIRNMIENIIMGGGIVPEEDDRLGSWVTKIKYEKEIEKMKEKATKEGDLDAMYALGLCYSHGEKGLEINDTSAFHWYKKAADCFHIKSMACVGYYLVMGGNGIKKNQTEGLCLLSFAAMGGSNAAAYNLGAAYKHGLFGLERNKKMAKMWLLKAMDSNCKHNQITKSQMNIVKSMLKNL